MLLLVFNTMGIVTFGGVLAAVSVTVCAVICQFYQTEEAHSDCTAVLVQTG